MCVCVPARVCVVATSQPDEETQKGEEQDGDPKYGISFGLVGAAAQLHTAGEFCVWLGAGDTHTQIHTHIYRWGGIHHIYIHT